MKIGYSHRPVISSCLKRDVAMKNVGARLPVYQKSEHHESEELDWRVSSIREASDFRRLTVANEAKPSTCKWMFFKIEKDGAKMGALRVDM